MSKDYPERGRYVDDGDRKAPPYDDRRSPVRGPSRDRDDVGRDYRSERGPPPRERGYEQDYDADRGYERPRGGGRDREYADDRGGRGRDVPYDRRERDREYPEDRGRGRDDDRRRGDDWDRERGERHDDRYGGERGGGRGRDYRGDSREERRERRPASRSRSRERRSRSPRDRPDPRYEHRYDSRRGRGGGRGGRRDDYDDDEPGAAYSGYRPRRRQGQQDPSRGDKPLPPGAGPGSIQDPFHHLRQNVPTDPAEAQRLWLEQQLRSRQMVLQQQAASAAAASAKTQRELYIGNLVPGAVTADALKQLFNTTLVAAFPAAGTDPVVAVNLHSDGRYAFVEFRSPEMATAALALNAQVQLLGQTISVGRPSGYVDPTKAAIAATAAAGALAAFQAGDMDALAANAAAAGMNLTQLGLANLLLPGGAAAGAAAAAAAAAAALPAPVAAAPAPVVAAAVPSSMSPPLVLPLPPATNGSAAAHAASPASAPADPDPDGCGPPSAWFAVSHMLQAAMLADDEEYESVLEDLEDECNRPTPGSVVAVKVPRPPPELRGDEAAFMGQGNYGKAFVAFRDAHAAQRAHAAIHGRLFAGNKVHVRYMSREEYDAV
ncbi:hypothetical protein HYH03_015757 [Edaphochlamys debaryana]|uniref:RRM domain-containing protein n=1 Tax=Edaphochlamys debaryana TaxID=47281 RepID=A0A835XMG8_9CHLO|nr:hypothetical protein HYH03_015757 [Edaphochlamys debaryana]|eukprot:KAG2485483.1 hypothetical protein HYH03_015757 [Edaphochlamys debaryana]